MYNSSSLETPPRIYSNLPQTPRLETLRFDSFPFSSIVSGLLADVYGEEPGDDPSSIDLRCDPEYYTDIRDTLPEWADEQEVDDFFTEELSAKVPSPVSGSSGDAVVGPVPITPSLSESGSPCGPYIPSLSDFLIHPTTFTNGVGTCIRRSDGRLYAIKRVLQTRKAWSQLAILVRIKEARAPFNLSLHWTFERDRYVYLIMENYPNGTLAQAVGRHGVLGSLEVFFYACEIIMGLRSLHDAGIVHRNVSPDTIVFDRHGHVILSGIEYGTILLQNERYSQDKTDSCNKHHQAPELLLGWNHDTLVDSWSFGMVLYFMFHGKHAFLSETNGTTTNSEQVVGKILSEGLPNKTIRVINPVARDLILQCLERNPAMRPTTRKIQHHPYFSNADWDKVLKRRFPAPLGRDFLALNMVQSSTRTRKPEVSARGPCSSPQASAFGFGSNQPPFRFLGSPFSTPRPRHKLERSLPELDHSLAQFAVIPEKVNHERTSAASSQERSVSSSKSKGFQSNKAQGLARGAHGHNMEFWDSLDRENPSPQPKYTVLSNRAMPFSRAWKLRKERSLMIHPRKLFNLSTAWILQKLRRGPNCIATVKYTAYAEPVTNLPSGLSQIGSGIGFTYNAPTACVGSETPVASGSCLRPGFSSYSRATIAAPKACHGLFHSLSLSSFWTGFKSNSVGVHSIPSLPTTGSAKDSTGLSGCSAVPNDQPEEKGGFQPGVTQPLVKQTTNLLRSQGHLSSLAPSSTEPTLTEEALTPDAVEFQPGKTMHIVGNHNVEIKSSKEAHSLRPESTLRLVTPLNGPKLPLNSK